MQILTFDFETYYDRQLSLSKMTTEAYLRDPRFEVIGVAVKQGDAPAQWFSGTPERTKAWLAQFPWSESLAVAHNAMFDAAILNWHFGLRPRMVADTLSMARALDGPDAANSLAKLAERHGLGRKGDEVLHALGKRRLDFSPSELAKYGDYCINDVELTYELFRLFARRIPPSEAKLIDLTVRMFSEPVLRLDTEVLETHLTEVRAKKAALMAAVDANKEAIMSNPKLAALLSSLGIDPPTKISPTTGKETWAFSKTDEGFTALLDHPDQRVQAVVAARLGVKSTLEETRTERFLEIAERGALPIPLRYYGTHTSRWSGQDNINIQNLPRKSALKRAVMAPEGHVVIDCDSSQIEARILAWMAGQNDLVEFFRRNDEENARGVPKHEMQFDPYRLMASQIYGVNVSDITPEQRQVGKIVLLGSGYGMGGRKLMLFMRQQGITVDLESAQRIVDIYRATFPCIPHLWKQGDAALEAMVSGYECSIGQEGVLRVNPEGIHLPNGFKIRYANLRKELDPALGYTRYRYDTRRGASTVAKDIWGGSCTENWCQALARIVIGEQMLMIARRYRVVMTVHDSIVAVAPKHEATEAQRFVEECMRIRPKWADGLPLNCESKVGDTYGA